MPHAMGVSNPALQVWLTFVARLMKSGLLFFEIF
jgi:hypothetical protein